MSHIFAGSSTARCRWFGIVVVVVLGMVVVPMVGAQSFGLTPNADGQLDPWIDLGWQWSDELAGRIELRSRSSTVFDDTPDPADLEQAVTTIERSYRLALDPLVWNPRLSDHPTVDTRLGVGLGLHGEYWDIRETGFIDFADQVGDEEQTVRLFFNNLRAIYAFKPAIVGRFSVDAPGISVSADASYAPWMGIWLNHQLSSASEVTAYNTPSTTRAFEGSSLHAWRFGGQLSVDLGPVALQVEGGVGGAEYAYSMIALGGTTAQAQVYVVDGFLRGLISVPQISIGGIVPQLGFGFESVATQNLAAPTPTWERQLVPKVAIGFQVR